jgi:(p)ppGpp synthase/HD superfamily hydrolase
MQKITSNGAFSGANVPSIKSTQNLIAELHEGQVDYQKQPYVLHPRRVATNVLKIDPQASDDVVMAALLHDTIEDCGIHEEFLRQKGYSEDCITMVSLVTKLENDEREYDQVIDDLIASGNRDAMIVKLADNMDNLHPDRARIYAAENPEKAQRLADRYRASIEKLSAAIGVDGNYVFELIENSPKIEFKNIGMEPE